jgi:Ca2+-binding EF-hand superfamily protein
MIRHGQKVNDESVNVMMKEIDPENKGKITFPEFCKMVTNQE